MLEKYGVENPAQAKDIKDKIRLTNIERYGGTAPAKNKDVVEKMKSTCKKKFGYSVMPGALASHNKFKQRWIDMCNENNLIWTDSDNFRGKYDNGPITYHFKCKECGSEFIDNFHSQPFPICRNCHPNWHNTSKAEKEIVQYLKKHYDGAIIENDRNALNGKELDIFVPEKNVAVEFNGTYWHSFKGGDLQKFLNKHQEKRLLCESKDIHLITIDEIDFKNCKDSLLNFILDTILGNNTDWFGNFNDLRFRRGVKTIECNPRYINHKQILDRPLDIGKFFADGGQAIYDLGYS